jgi:hypothetical protein
MKNNTRLLRAEPRGNPTEIDNKVDANRPGGSVDDSTLPAQKLSSSSQEPGSKNSPHMKNRPAAPSQPRGRPFQNGNRLGRGRPKGSLNKTTLAIRELFASEGLDVAKKCIEMAKQGNAVALPLAMKTISSLRRGAPVPWDMPPIRDQRDLAAAYRRLLGVVADGTLTPAEAQEYIALFEKLGPILDPLIGLA